MSSLLNLKTISFTSSSSTVSNRSTMSLTKATTTNIQLNKTPLTTQQNTTEHISTKTASRKASDETAKMYGIVEAVSDRIEMHENVGVQRDNWNSLLLGSVNSMTLAATTLAAISAGTSTSHNSHVVALNLSSAILFSAAAGISAVMAKIQPSQLAEEQRNASRLFRRVRARIETLISVVGGYSVTESDVSEAIEEILALDRAFPLPLLGGAMIEKFPERFEPAVWWPRKKKSNDNVVGCGSGEMREIARVLRSKDLEEYERLGGLVLGVNKVLAIVGPAAAAVAAASTLLVGSSEWAAGAAVGGGAVATAVNSIMHGAQLGMVVEMYRNCAGFLSLIEDTIIHEESNNVENGESLFRINMALSLGRSFSQMEEIAAKSVKARDNGTDIDEFACQLFLPYII